MLKKNDFEEQCGFVCVLGAANAGKSTLVNALTGQKVSIVSPKPHTTRNQIYGILSSQPWQIIFVDTPGLIQRPSDALQTYMRKTVWKNSREADLCLILLDVCRPGYDLTERLLEHACSREKNVFLLFNKVDGIEKEKLLPIADRFRHFDKVAKFFMISAEKKKGLQSVQDAIIKYLPISPWLFPEDSVTQVSNQFMAAELTREKIFQWLHQEVPYNTHVETDLWHIAGHDLPPGYNTLPASGITIFQTIFVEREGHRKLILGQGGRRIKAIGQNVRQELSQRLGQPVHLFLYVKINPDWKDKQWNYSYLS